MAVTSTPFNLARLVLGSVSSTSKINLGSDTIKLRAVTSAPAGTLGSGMTGTAVGIASFVGFFILLLGNL